MLFFLLQHDLSQIVVRYKDFIFHHSDECQNPGGYLTSLGLGLRQDDGKKQTLP